MNFTQLRYFVAVAQSRNLTRASAELRVAQPAISRQIKLLEEELGTPLLVRHHRGVELTDAGTLLQQRSEFLVRTLEETRTEIMELSAEPTGELRLGCPPSLTRHLIGEALEQYLNRHPRVRVRLQEAMSDHLCQLVLSDQLDMAIISTFASKPHLETTPLYPEAIWLFGPPGKLSRRTPVPLQAIAKLPLLLSMPNNATRALLERRMAEAGLTMKVLVETDSIAVVHNLVQKGIGYTAAPFSSHQDSIKAGLMSGGPIADLVIQRSLVRRSDRPITRAMQAFLIVLQDQITYSGFLAMCDLSAPRRKKRSSSNNRKRLSSKRIHGFPGRSRGSEVADRSGRR